MTPLQETLGFLDDAGSWQRQDRRLRVLKLPRLATDRGCVPGSCQRLRTARDAATAVRPAGAGDRVRVRSSLPGCECRLAAVASPLAGGWLTGKYQRDANPRGATRLGADPKRGMAAWEPRNKPERTWQILHTVEQIARAKGVIQGQVSLAWLEELPTVTSVILGVRQRPARRQPGRHIRRAHRRRAQAPRLGERTRRLGLSLRCGWRRPTSPRDRRQRLSIGSLSPHLSAPGKGQ